MLNFPASPINGTQYAGPNGVLYQYQVPPGIWVDTGPTTPGGAPSGPASGDLAGSYPNPIVKSFGTMVSAEAFGAVGDGVTDDRAALQAAIDYLTARGGGQLLLGKRYLVDSGDLNLKYGVTLQGYWKNYVKDPSHDHSHAQSCLVINPTYTIRVMTWMTSIDGMLILKKGLFRPVDIRSGLDLLKSYAGTAVTVGNGVIGDPGSDFYIGYTTFGGFNKALYIDGCSRPHVEWVNFDCTNGIDIRACYDMDHISHCHGWGFLQAHGAWNFSWSQIANVTNNGSGQIRITTIPAHPHHLVTGDNQTFASEVVGVPNANAPYTVTVIDANTVDFQGSVFAGAYVSGGKLWAGDGRRLGTAYYFETIDWLQANTIFEFGWDIGIHCNSCNIPVLFNIGTDNYYPDGNTAPIGVYIQNCYQTTISQASFTSQGIGFLLDTTADGTTTLYGARMLNNLKWQAQIKNGSVNFIGCTSDAVSGFRLEAPNIYNTLFVGGDYKNTAMSVIPGTNQPAVFQVNGWSTQVNSALTLLPQAATLEGGEIGFKTVLADAHDLTVDVFNNAWRGFATPKAGGANVGLWGMKLDGTGFDLVTQPLTWNNGAYALVQSGTRLTASGGFGAAYLMTVATTVASLPAAASTGAGRTMVTDATMALAAGLGTVVVGGGGNTVPVYSDGAGWRIG